MPHTPLPDILRHSPVRVIFRPGALADVGHAARELNAQGVLLVTDPGIVAAGHVDRAVHALRNAAATVTTYAGVSENPTTEHVLAGVEVARETDVDLIIALGGGSAMDCAKGINLILTNGGRMADYRGDPPPDVLANRKPLLPMILIPTTAGTGSEAQSFALISDAVTHEKMACGDRRLPTQGGLRPHVAILDPDLIRTAPPSVAAAAGVDAITHAIETAATNRRTDVSRAFSVAAWQRVDAAFERYLTDPSDDLARADMLLGAHLAGAAIEQSMLGAAHACSNPLTARFGIVHGRAVGLLMPHVIRYNSRGGTNHYADLCEDPERLARHVESLLDAVCLPRRLSAYGVSSDALDAMARSAADQWTARCNPIHVESTDILNIYLAAM